MKIHLIAIGGRIMHTLALVLQSRGHEVTGSDDEIYEPSRTNLSEAGLLPALEGWFPEKITGDIDLIILGMHARSDNPELLKAMELGISVLSYPEFIGNFATKKMQIVVVGSHGKTTTTAMIMHVLNYRNIDFDYLVGAELKGFDGMVKLTDAPIMVLEGDEYLSSCLDPSPKFNHYKADIAVFTGISWDHINVFKTEESYINLFRDYLEQSADNTKLIIYEEDPVLMDLVKGQNSNQNIGFYSPLPVNEKGNILYDNKQYKLNVFGRHNMANMSAALSVCRELGISAPDFFAAISSFRGASKRLELIIESGEFKLYRDFAHSPSKVKATLNAVREQYPEHLLVAVLELHTYSSLNKQFHKKYEGVLSEADVPILYYAESALKIKKMEHLDPHQIKLNFANPDLIIYTNNQLLAGELKQFKDNKCIILAMSSGNFDGMDLKGLFE